MALLMFYFSILQLLFTIVFSLKGKDPNEVYGIVMLDAITFPKIIPSDRHASIVIFEQKTNIGLPTSDAVRDHFLGIAAGCVIVL